ncbi:MAG TPA: O-antigen ligase family protein, partial [Caldilineaceae bacterium]|nr:O-antigen ligase family protein [Caldilineaceae bacterium]
MKILHRLLGMELLWLALLSPFVVFPGRWLPLAVQPLVILGLFCFPLVRLVKGQTRLVIDSPVTIPILLILLWLPVNIWVAPNSPLAWSAAGYLLYGIAWYGALVRWSAARGQPVMIARLLLSAGCGLALVAPPVVAWKADFRLFHLPIYDWFESIHINLGEGIHANILAGALTLILPLLLALLLHPWSTLTTLPWQPDRQLTTNQGRRLVLGVRFVLGLLFCYAAGLLVLTQSRGGLLATAATLPLIVLLRWPKLWRLTPVALVLVVLAIWWYSPSMVVDELSKDGSLGGWQNRLEMWHFSVMALYDFLFTGIGIGAFSITLPLLYPIPFDVAEFPHAHNLLLQVGLDLGLPGLIAYLALLINLFVML